MTLEQFDVASRFALVDVGRDITNADGHTVMRFRTTYGLIAAGDRWKVYAITRHD